MCLPRLDLVEQALQAKILGRGLDAEPLEPVNQLLNHTRENVALSMGPAPIPPRCGRYPMHYGG